MDTAFSDMALKHFPSTRVVGARETGGATLLAMKIRGKVTWSRGDDANQEILGELRTP